MGSKRKFLAVLLFVVLFNASDLAWAVASQGQAGDASQKEESAVVHVESTAIKVVKVTAYSSTPDQTDDSPFTMANGKRVHDGAIAANFLPFGTKVRFPELYGDKEFVVEDRMHKRFSDRVDIWMEKQHDARMFGIQKITMEIL